MQTSPYRISTITTSDNPALTKNSLHTKQGTIQSYGKDGETKVAFTDRISSNISNSTLQFHKGMKNSYFPHR